jgi:hypothetical protein
MNQDNDLVSYKKSNIYQTSVNEKDICSKWYDWDISYFVETKWFG